MAAKDIVIAHYPAAHAEYIPAEHENGLMIVPATWALCLHEGVANQRPQVAPTENEVWEKGAASIVAAAAAVVNASTLAAELATVNDSIREYMTSVYQTLWNDWYAGIEDAEPAQLDIRFQDGTDGYDNVEHKHYFFVSDGNRPEIIDDRDNNFDLRSKPATWHNWYIVMVHEMIHEYQFKVLNDETTLAGQNLHDNAHKNFTGPGHGSGFYTAIANRAPYFHVTDVPAFIQIL